MICHAPFAPALAIIGVLRDGVTVLARLWVLALVLLAMQILILHGADRTTLAGAALLWLPELMLAYAAMRVLSVHDAQLFTIKAAVRFAPYAAVIVAGNLLVTFGAPVLGIVSAEAVEQRSPIGLPPADAIAIIAGAVVHFVLPLFVPVMLAVWAVGVARGSGEGPLTSIRTMRRYAVRGIVLLGIVSLPWLGIQTLAQVLLGQEGTDTLAPFWRVWLVAAQFRLAVRA